MPKATVGALIGMQFPYEPGRVNIADHFFGLLARIVDLLGTRRTNGTYNFML